ncbi:MAG: hypothetical protein DRZ82_02580 [Thermoprotei archaeon]|nr:MAG: hypothetical protein DRZ82_02580 [Thermoprotei archaeon]
MILRHLKFHKLFITRKASLELSEIASSCDMKETSRDALSTAFGIAITGNRVAVFCKDYELFESLDLLYNMVVTGVRGSLLIMALRSNYKVFDPRIVSENTWAPVLEPLLHEEVFKFVEVGSELSEAIEVPFIISIPLAVFKAKVEMPVEGIDVEPIFSKHWEIKYRWILNDDHYDRILTLGKIYRRLFSVFEFNKVEGVRERTIVAFGLAYDLASELLEEWKLRDKVSLIGISLYVPQCFMPSVKALGDLRKCKRIIVVEHGMPLIRLWLEREVHEKDIVSSLEVRDVPMSDVPLMSVYWTLTIGLGLDKRDFEEYLRRITALSPKRVVTVKKYVKVLQSTLEGITKELESSVIVVGEDRIVKELIDYTKVSKVKRDYSITMRRYPILLPIDVFDLSLPGTDVLHVAKGIKLTNIRAVVLAVVTGKTLLRLRDELGDGEIPLIIITSKERINEIKELLRDAYQVTEYSKDDLMMFIKSLLQYVKSEGKVPALIIPIA